MFLPGNLLALLVRKTWPQINLSTRLYSGLSAWRLNPLLQVIETKKSCLCPCRSNCTPVAEHKPYDVKLDLRKHEITRRYEVNIGESQKHFQSNWPVCERNLDLVVNVITHKPGRPVNVIGSELSPSIIPISSVQSGESNLLHLKLRHPQQFIRHMSISRQPPEKQNLTAILYIAAVLIGMLGMSYAGVPLYRMFCQATGLGGVAVKGHDKGIVENMKPVKERMLTVKFNADTASNMQWNFQPQQSEVRVLPGETALAFYTARNPTDRPIIGISTYNVLPFEAGQYFNKIQCFCFEEQRLNPHEQVDMPVFFFIDPEYAEDPKLEDVDTICLSYTFFEAKEGLKLPLPGYMQPT